jgi:anti-sigma factor RsiW
MTTANESGRGDIEDLLPWHAAGTLSPRDAHRVETALAADPELARRYELVREELAQTIHLNETLGAPRKHCSPKSTQSRRVPRRSPRISGHASATFLPRFPRARLPGRLPQQRSLLYCRPA